MSKCIMCGNIVENEDYHICDSCINKNITIENALSLGKDSTEKVEINGFIASYFKGHIDEMEDMLIKQIQLKYESDPDTVNTALKEYFDEDRESFIYLLEEK